VLSVTAGTVTPVSASQQGQNWHFVTNVTTMPTAASVTFTFSATPPPGAEVVLTISHGCPPEEEQFDATLATQVHDEDHNDITGGTVFAPDKTGGTAAVHDLATVIEVSGTVASGTVTFKLHSGTLNCDSENPSTESVPLGTFETAEPGGTSLQATSSTVNLGPGTYSYEASAHLVSDKGSELDVDADECEPFTVIELGRTMGYWGNVNGVARIEGAGGYLANSVDIGRGGEIDTKAESLKVLPLTLNACGKGSPLIFTGAGAPTANKDCTSATGVNKGTLNTASAQTLALGYNIKIIGIGGQTIGSMGCGAYAAAVGLTESNTAQDAFTKAQSYIENSRPGGTTTQTNLGNINLLLNCLNREA
jgi:hypothetical protein